MHNVIKFALCGIGTGAVAIVVKVGKEFNSYKRTYKIIKTVNKYANSPEFKNMCQELGHI